MCVEFGLCKFIRAGDTKIGDDGGTLSHISGLEKEILNIWRHFLILENQMSIQAKVGTANTISYWDIDKCYRSNTTFLLKWDGYKILSLKKN